MHVVLKPDGVFHISTPLVRQAQEISESIGGHIVEIEGVRELRRAMNTGIRIPKIKSAKPDEWAEALKLVLDEISWEELGI